MYMEQTSPPAMEGLSGEISPGTRLDVPNDESLRNMSGLSQEGLPNEEEASEGDNADGDVPEEFLREVPSSLSSGDHDEEEEEEEGENDEEDPPPSPFPQWSSVLRTPSTGPLFSPSLDVNKSGSLHGLGLTFTVDRFKQISRIEKRCAVLLHSVAEAHDTLGVSVTRIYQNYSLRENREDVIRVIGPFAKRSQGLAVTWKACASRPIMGNSVTLGEASLGVFNGYVAAREKSGKTRQMAIKARSKYVRAVRDAENAVKDLKRAKKADEDNKMDVSADNVSLGDAAVGGGMEETVSSDQAVPDRDLSMSYELNASNSSQRKNAWEDVKKRFGTAPGMSKLSERTIAALNSVQSSETLYCSLVEEENKAVTTSHSMETDGLQTLQDMEEARLSLMLSALSRALQAEKEALDNMDLSISQPQDQPIPSPNTNPSLTVTTTTTTTGISSLPTTPVRKPSITQPQSSPFNFRHKRANSSNNKEDLSDPSITDQTYSEDVNSARHKIKYLIQTKTQRYSYVKSISAFTEELANSAEEFSNAILLKLQNEGYTGHTAKKNFSKSADPLSVSFERNEGPRVVKCWMAVMDSCLSTAQSAMDLAGALRKIHHDTLDPIILHSEKDLRVTGEIEETRWKSLQDASRNEIRIRSRYDSNRVEFSKAKERLVNVDESTNETTEDVSDDISVASSATPGREESDASFQLNSSTPKMNPAMKKALGNIFSILPSGGEEAMSKMLSRKHRVSIAKSTCTDAENKVHREKRNHDASVISKRRAMEGYISNAKNLEIAWEKEEEEVQSKIRLNLEGVTESWRKFTNERRDKVSPLLEMVTAQETNGNVMEDIQDWTLSAQIKLKKAFHNAEHQVQEQEETRDEQEYLHKLKNPMGKADFTLLRRIYPSSSGNIGFSLRLDLVESKMVYSLLAVLNGEKNDVEDTEGEDIHTVPSSDSLLSRGDSLARARAESGGTVSSETTTTSQCTDTLNDEPLKNHETDLLDTKELQSIASLLKDETLQQQQSPTQSTSTISPPTNLTASLKPDTEIFSNHFNLIASPDEKLIDSFSCAYWPDPNEGFLTPLLHGRMFATNSAMYFCGWGEKKIVLSWNHVTHVKKETTVMGTVHNALSVEYLKQEKKGSFFFGSFTSRDGCYQLLMRLSAVARELGDMERKSVKPATEATPIPAPAGPPVPTVTVNEEKVKLPKVPPDAALNKMETILDKKMKNVSIETFYTRCLSEGNRTDAEPLFLPWLKSKGNMDLLVNDWEFWDDDGGDGKKFVNKWCGEEYRQKRLVKFRYNRKTHLYIGPPVASVTQIHRCRVQENDKCVLQITISFDGIPYSDTFCIEVRMVARRVGNCDLHVQAGIFVDMKKSSMFKSKIRSGAITESTPVYQDLFQDMKRACEESKRIEKAEDVTGGVEDEEDVDVEEEEEEDISSQEGTLDDVERSAIDDSNGYYDIARKFGEQLVKLFSEGLEDLPPNYLVPAVAVAILFLFFIGRRFLSGNSLPINDALPSSSPPSHTDTLFSTGTTSQSDMTTLTAKVDEMHSEMKQIRILLSDLVLIMKEKSNSEL